MDETLKRKRNQRAQTSKEVSDASTQELEALGFKGDFESVKETQTCCSEVKASLLSIQLSLQSSRLASL